MSSDPESPPLPCCAGQPEAGCAPLALTFPFACVGSPLLYNSGQQMCSLDSCKLAGTQSEVMQCLSLPCLHLSKEMVFYLPAPHSTALFPLYTQRSSL